jgi:hypothetical protein
VVISQVLFCTSLPIVKTDRLHCVCSGHRRRIGKQIYSHGDGSRVPHVRGFIHQDVPVSVAVVEEYTTYDMVELWKFVAKDAVKPEERFYLSMLSSDSLETNLTVRWAVLKEILEWKLKRQGCCCLCLTEHVILIKEARGCSKGMHPSVKRWKGWMWKFEAVNGWFDRQRKRKKSVATNDSGPGGWELF